MCVVCCLDAYLRDNGAASNPGRRIPPTVSACMQNMTREQIDSDEERWLARGR